MSISTFGGSVNNRTYRPAEDSSCGLDSIKKADDNHNSFTDSHLTAYRTGPKKILVANSAAAGRISGLWLGVETVSGKWN